MTARLERVNLLLLVLLISIVVGLWVVPVFRQGLLSEIASGFLFAAFMQPLYELLHQAMHGMFHRNKRVNDAVGTAIAAFLPSSFSLIQMVHVGHHVSNRSSRERIEYYADGASAWRQSVFYYAILLGLNWLGFVLQNIVFMLLPARTTKAHGIDRNFGATLPQLSIKKLAGIRLEFFCVLALHIALLTLTPVTLRQ